jgi:hypothetical protein
MRVATRARILVAFQKQLRNPNYMGWLFRLFHVGSKTAAPCHGLSASLLSSILDLGAGADECASVDFDRSSTSTPPPLIAIATMPVSRPVGEGDTLWTTEKLAASR